MRTIRASDENGGASGGPMYGGAAARPVGSGGAAGRAMGRGSGVGGTTGAAGKASPSGGSGVVPSGTGGSGADNHGRGGAGTGGEQTENAGAEESGGLPGTAGAGEGGSPDVDECSPGLTVAGPIVAGSQADLELLRGVATVQGNLSIHGDVTDLTPLHCLNHVQGTFMIDATTVLQNLDGLEALTTVDKWLAIGDGSVDGVGNAALSNVDGLSGVTTAEDIIVARNAVLEEVDSLNTVASSDVQVLYNPALVRISGLRSLTSAWNGFDLIDNPLLKDISGLAELTSIGNSLDIRNVGLENFDAFSKLEKAPFVDIEGVPSLKDISGFSKLGTVTSMFFFQVAMPHLMGLESLRSVDSFSVQGDPELVDLAGLENLESVNYFVLGSLHQLESLSNLQSLEAVDAALQLYETPKVRSLEGLGRIASVDYLSFYYTGLEDLEGLDSLTTVLSLTLQSNASLVSLDGVESLRTLSSLTVYDNGQLPTCAAEGLVTRLGPNAVAASIAGNDDDGVCTP